MRRARGTPPAASSKSESRFSREGEYWTIEYGGEVLRLRHSKGLHYLALLLTHPGERFAADELMRSSGSGDGPDGLDLERARTAVSKRIKDAIQRVAQYHPMLGHLLSTSIKTGYRCAYLPGPGGPIRWENDATKQQPSNGERPQAVAGRPDPGPDNGMSVRPPYRGRRRES
jgi:hypothetical protein